ncbi:MAG: Fic family protein [Pirellulaceae bacterium]|nr:Fic family protein [Pirellulaceae bacterium]
MSVQVSHQWSPIDDLPDNWQESLCDPSTTALVTAWLQQADELRGKDLYRRFLGKLQRQWAIETGVLEGIYSISEGATTALIEKGLDASLLSHEDTDLPAAEVIAKIQDHETAIGGLYDFLSGNRRLSTSYIKELHQVLTAHQDTYIARDTLGNLVTRRLPRGEWKLLPNNVEHPDGRVFQYCPPEHVQMEMERLLELHHKHEEEHVSPDVEAAWLHHRFTLIHPFTDGNGRIARCLGTLVLLKAHWLPLVITRHDRTPYISALRNADDGDLSGLVQFVGTLQRRAIRQALSLGEDVIHEANAIQGVLKNIRIKFARNGAHLDELRDGALQTADTIQGLLKDRLREVALEINETIQHAGEAFRARMIYGDRGNPKGRFNYIQIVQCAKKLGYFADFNRYQSWAGIEIQTFQHTEILFSLHGVGREHAGILGVSAMAYSKSQADDGTRLVDDVYPLSDEPFEFAYAEHPESVLLRFRRWMESCFATGLDWWQKQL